MHETSTSSNPNQAMADRLGAGLYHLEVEEARPLSPSMRRLRLHAAGLGSMDYQPGQDLMLSVPLGDRMVWRRYTVRTLDRETDTVTVDIVVHGDGPGARWARQAKVGDSIEAIGPRGKVTVSKDAQWHLFVGDAAFLAAAFAMAEAVPAGVPTAVLLHVDSDNMSIYHPPACVATQFATSHAHLMAMLQAWNLPGPPAGGRAYVGGEAKAVVDIRALLSDKGLPAEAMSVKAYWRADASNADHGEPGRT